MQKLERAIEQSPKIFKDRQEDGLTNEYGLLPRTGKWGFDQQIRVKIYNFNSLSKPFNIS